MDVGGLRQVLSVLLVFSLLGLALWKLRRPGSACRPLWRKQSGSARALEPVERLALTPQHVLHLVKVQGHEIVVATHPNGCTLLNGTLKGASKDAVKGAGA